MNNPRRLLRALGPIVAAALFLAAEGADAAAWWRLPLWGAEVRAFTLDPFEPGVLYCGTSRGNFYESRDAGSTWEPMHAGPAFPGYYVTSLVADPAVPGRLWASVAGELGGGLVVESNDRGANWTVLLRSSKTVMTRALALAPGLPRVLAVGGDDGVRLSADGGKTWARTGESVDGLLQVESLAFDPADRRVLYAGTWRQAFRTKDAGSSWNRIAEGMVLDATVYAWDFRRRRHEGCLGLDVRLGLPLARRRRSLDAFHDGIHEPALAQRPPRSHAPGRRLRGDGRRAPSLRRRRRDLGAHHAGVARRDGARGRSALGPPLRRDRRARASSIRTTAAARSNPARAACRRAAWPSS